MDFGMCMITYSFSTDRIGMAKCIFCLIGFSSTLLELIFQKHIKSFLDVQTSLLLCIGILDTSYQRNH